MADEQKTPTQDVCAKCGAPMGEITTTASGKRLQRCTAGSWDPATKKNVGCDGVVWLEAIPQELDETCPTCGNKLIMTTTRFGKKMKKCSTGGWDKVEKKAIGCDYVEWINGTTETIDEACPDCGKPLVLFTTNAGKKMKKCSTAGWDRENKKATGCTYVQWLKATDLPKEANGEEFLPPEPPAESGKNFDF